MYVAAAFCKGYKQRGKRYKDVLVTYIPVAGEENTCTITIIVRTEDIQTVSNGMLQEKVCCRCG